MNQSLPTALAAGLIQSREWTRLANVLDGLEDENDRLQTLSDAIRVIGSYQTASALKELVAHLTEKEE